MVDFVLNDWFTKIVQLDITNQNVTILSKVQKFDSRHISRAFHWVQTLILRSERLTYSASYWCGCQFCDYFYIQPTINISTV